MTTFLIGISVLSFLLLFGTSYEFEKKLEEENLKYINKGNWYKYIFAAIISAIPVVNLIATFSLIKNEQFVYKEVKDLVCRLLINNTKLEKTYNIVKGKKFEELQHDLGLLKEIKSFSKDAIAEKINDKYTEVVFYEYNEQTKKLEEYIDDSFDEILDKPKVKKLVR